MPTSRVLCFALAVLALLAVARPASGQSNPDDERARFEENLLGVSHGVLLEFVQELQALEVQVASEGDYEQAIRIADRRIELLTRIAPAGGLERFEGIITLTADNAATTQREEQGGIGPWKQIGSEARWEVPRLKPGSYLVVAHYRSLAPSRFFDGGESNTPHFQFGEETRLGAATQLSFGLDTSFNFHTASVGIINAERNGATFLLKQTQASSRETRLRQVLLIPAAGTSATIAAHAPADEGPSPEPENLTLLRNAHDTRMRGLMNPLGTSYLAHLEKLSIDAGNDRSLAERIANESVRIRQGLANPGDWSYASLEVPQGQGSSASKGDTAQNQLERLRGATLVTGSALCGATFKIAHEGKEYPVHLSLIDCPTTIGSAAFGRYFDIDPKTAAELSEEASSFTERYLRKKTFTFATEWRTNPDGHYEGSVVLPGFGSLQRVLVSRGLASIRELDEYSTQSEKYLREILIAIEEEAKSTERGAWGVGR